MDQGRSITEILAQECKGCCASCQVAITCKVIREDADEDKTNKPEEV